MALYRSGSNVSMPCIAICVANSVVRLHLMDHFA